MPETIAQLIQLTGKVAVVTGGGAGVGRAIAARLAEAGAHVQVADVDAARAWTTADNITSSGAKASPVQLDVRDVHAITALAADVASECGRLDIWVNNAGIYPPSPLFTSTEEDWDRMLDINSRAVYFATREAARWMIKAGNGGVVINIASIAAYRAGQPNLAHYAASKAAVVTLTKTMSAALGPSGVRVVGISPGVVETEGLAEGSEAMDKVGGNLGNRAATLPLRRLGSGDDIARVALFLSSDLAGFVTGVTIPVDGGDLIGGVAAVPTLQEMGFE